MFYFQEVFSLIGNRNSAEISFQGANAPEPTGAEYQGAERYLRRSFLVRKVCNFLYQEKEKGFFFPGEHHPMLELTYVGKGSLHSVADGQELLLSQGELTVYGPGQWHTQYSDMDVSPSFVTITFDLAGDGWEALLNRKFSLSPQALDLMRQLLRERESAAPYSGDMVLSLLNLLLLTLLRQAKTAQEKPQAASSENEVILRAQQYIFTHIEQRLTVPVVAQAAKVSPSYLTALFHKHLQISPGEYIRRMKLQVSKERIREGNRNFTEIAASLQYSSVHHFSRQFKDKFGISPSEYAKSVR